MSTGIAALLVASDAALLALRVLGSVYLVFLGARGIYAAFERPRGDVLTAGEPASVRVTPSVALRQGLLSNLANPKMAAFFTSLLPQFANSFSGLLALGLFCSLTLVG